MTKKIISLMVSVNILAAFVFTSAGAQVAAQPVPYQNQKYPDLCQILTRTLKYGDQGTDVKKLQIVLGQEGVAYLNASGYYDLPTSKAVKTFQRLAGIYQVGKVGPQTLTRMRNLWCGGSQINPNVVNPVNPYNPQIPGTNSPTVLDSQDPSISIFPKSSSGNSVDISWSAPSYATCVITNNLSPESFQVSNFGSKVFSVFYETNFKLTCSNYSGKSASKIITVKPSQSGIPAPTVTVSINPSSVLVGQTATVYWSSQNASYCSANFSGSLYSGNNTSNLPTTGSQQVTVTTGQQSFTVTCFNSSGQSTAQSVYANGSTQPTNSGTPNFNVTPYSSTVTSGQSATLNITGTNISSCSVNGGIYSNYNIPLIQTLQYPNNSSSASLTVNPTTSTTYTFNCRGTNGQNASSQSVYVTVNSNTVNTNNLQLTVTTNKSTYNVGENIITTVVLRNNSNSQISYSEPICSLYGPFSITVDDNDFYSSIESSLRAVCLAYGNSTIVLNPGESKTYTYTALIGNKYFSQNFKMLKVTLTNLGTTVSGQTYFSINNSGTSGGNATLNISPTSGAAPLSVNITPNLNGVTYFGGVTINYGDGSASEIICNPGTSNCMIKTHVYNTAGTYYVTITGNTGSQQIVLATSNVTVSGSTSANTLYWSFAGPLAGKICTQINEGSDPHNWADNYLCANQDIGLLWSSTGRPQGSLNCIQITEPSDNNAWGDNFLCQQTNSNYPMNFQWSYAGPISGKQCVKVNEPSDPNNWDDNYLCY